MSLRRLPANLRAAVFCLLALLVLSTVVGAGHIHPASDTSSDCAICLQSTGHAIASSNPVLPPVHIGLQPLVPAATRQSLSTTPTDLSIRGPPTLQH